MRLRLFSETPNFRILDHWIICGGISLAAVLLSIAAFFVFGLNFGIDFRGGSSIRAESRQAIDIGAYRSALAGLGIGDVVISEVFDPTFGPERHVVQIRVQAQDEEVALSPERLEEIRNALLQIDPTVIFTSVETVGPKVSGELITAAILAVSVAIAAMLIYIWFRFEWQFGVGAVVALLHDIILTIGVFSVLQIRFDLTTIAAILTIIGYSINDTVVVFDRIRENLIKYKKRELIEVMNLSINETLSRTLMTSLTTLLALVALFVFGGDVILGFVFAMIWGVFVGTWSSIYVAAVVTKRLGVRRDLGSAEKGETAH